MKTSFLPSLLKIPSIKAFNRVLFLNSNPLFSKKKQTFDFEGIISKFVKKNHPARVALHFKASMVTKLSKLKPGQAGVIKEFNDNDIFLKLMEMGCVPGEKIILEQVAPLGDPISVTVAGYRLSLRLNEAEHIIVEVNN
jgi:ferrous iron transport protein A